MDTLELTREDISDNEQITISDISNPLTVDDGDYFHVYIGISATSLCEVDLVFTDDFNDYGNISLERLTGQENMYALHFSLDSYLYDYQESQYRNSEFFITAYTCGELSEEAELSISQKGCEHTCAIIKCILTSGGSLNNTSELSGFTFGEGVSYLDIEVMQDKVKVICSGNCISELGNNNTGSTFQDDDLVEIILPETLTILHGSGSDNEGIFSYSGLKKADLSNITKIGAWTFEGCEFYAILPNTSSEIDYYNNLGGCAIVSSALTEIGESAFGSNENLRKVELPSGVTTLYRTFHDCHSLTSVTIPNSVTSIGYEAFEECDSLTSVTIPNSVTSIGEDAFAYCNSLTSVTIGNSVTSIGRLAFYSCDSLRTVTCKSGNPPTIVTNTFDNDTLTNGVLHVPSGLASTYRSRGWEFNTIREDA